jgi:hypothetical protein
VKALRALCWFSGGYDLVLAVGMLFAAPQVAAFMGAPPPQPLVNAQLNGLFTLCLGVGYFWAAADLTHRSGYVWVAGVLAKGLGAALFVLDHFTQGSPTSFLLFAFTDGVQALVSAVLLLRRAPRA